jgi:uncharacterized protein with PIN domain
MNTQPFPEEMLRKIREDQRAGLPGRCPKCGGPLVKDTSPNVPGRPVKTEFWYCPKCALHDERAI